MLKDYKLDIDFTELREQKGILIDALDLNEVPEEIQGVISLMDSIQDQAVDNHGIPHEEVFGTSDTE